MDRYSGHLSNPCLCSSSLTRCIHSRRHCRCPQSGSSLRTARPCPPYGTSRHHHPQMQSPRRHHLSGFAETLSPAPPAGALSRQACSPATGRCCRQFTLVIFPILPLLLHLHQFFFIPTPCTTTPTTPQRRLHRLHLGLHRHAQGRANRARLLRRRRARPRRRHAHDFIHARRAVRVVQLRRIHHGDADDAGRRRNRVRRV